MIQRKLERSEYKNYLSCYRKMDRDGYLSSGFEEWPFEGVFEDGMSSHAFGIWQHLKTIKRDPEWMHYLPASDAYSEYHTDRITDYGGDMYEVRIESASEVWKFEHGW